MITIDIETTGFSSRDKIIQITCSKLDGAYYEMESYSTYINPGMPIPFRITELTGITDDDVKDAPVFDEQADTLYDFVGSELLVGYNVSFDKRFLIAADIRFKSKEFYDYMAYIKKRVSRVENYKLITILKHFGIRSVQLHNSIDDTAALTELIRRLGCPV